VIAVNTRSISCAACSASGPIRPLSTSRATGEGVSFNTVNGVPVSTTAPFTARRVLPSSPFSILRSARRTLPAIGSKAAAEVLAAFTRAMRSAALSGCAASAAYIFGTASIARRRFFRPRLGAEHLAPQLAGAVRQ